MTAARKSLRIGLPLKLVKDFRFLIFLNLAAPKTTQLLLPSISMLSFQKNSVCRAVEWDYMVFQLLYADEAHDLPFFKLR